MGLVLASGVRLGLAGCGIGLVSAFFATRLLRTLLFEVDGLDPAVLTLATLAVLLIAVLASVLPARHAALLEPAEALRGDS
jgi:ABC-type lipoprotein release transport system permease subunit